VQVRASASNGRQRVAALTKGQRVEYFVSIWAVCWILFFVACGAVEVTDSRWMGAAYAFVIGAVCYFPFVLWKLWRGKQSITRTTT
jgi:hypothetical protein